MDILLIFIGLYFFFFRYRCFNHFVPHLFYFIMFSPCPSARLKEVLEEVRPPEDASSAHGEDDKDDGADEEDGEEKFRNATTDEDDSGSGSGNRGPGVKIEQMLSLEGTTKFSGANRINFFIYLRSS